MTHTLVESEMAEPLVTLWQATTQAHCLHALAVPAALVVLRERRKRVHRLLPSSSGHRCTH